MTRASATGAVALVAIVAALVILWPRAGGFRTWLAEARDGDEDWGWKLLGAEVHHAYGGSEELYIADMSAADWEALDLAPSIDAWTDDGFARVEARLLTEPSTVPAFLIERRIVHGACDGDEPIALGVYEDRRPFQGSRFGAGGVTGGQARCNAAFAGSGG